MITKEELLQKGLSETDADKVIEALAETEDPENNSLQLLEKALNEGSEDKKDEEPLAKAKSKKEDDENEDEEDSEEKEMKESKKACGKMSKATEDMGKAIDDLDKDMDGAIVEMADLTPILKKIPTVIEFMAKAIEDISGQVMSISKQNEKSFDLMQKAGKVTVETAKSIDGFLSQPTGKKGKTAIPKEDMKKASEVSFSPESINHIYSKLMKATEDGDRKAGLVISAFESAGKDVNKLNPDHRKYIGELLNKEVH